MTQITYPLLKAFDTNGFLLAGGRVYSYVQGTSTPKSLYADAGYLTALTNPVILGATGEALMYVNGLADLYLHNADDVRMWGPITVGTGVGAVTVSADTTIPATVALNLAYGDIYTIADGVTLTINGPFTADLSQHFDCLGTGQVVFGYAIGDVYPEWWGAVPGAYAHSLTGPDSAAAINLAIASITSGRVRFNHGTYLCTDQVVVTDNHELVGMGENKTFIRAAANCTIATTATYRASLIMSGGNHSYITLRNFTVDGNKSNNATALYNGIGISKFRYTTGLPPTDADWGSNIILESVQVIDIPQNDPLNHTGCGLHIHADDVTMRDVRVSDCSAGIWTRGYRHKIYACKTHSNSDDGLDTWCDDVIIHGLSSYDNGGCGINPTGNLASPLAHLNNAVGNVNIRIVDCYLHDNVSEGIAAPNMYKFEIRGNIVENNAGGLSATGSITGIISKNVFISTNDGIAVGTQKEGVSYRRGYDVVVSDNVMQNTGKNVKIIGYSGQNASRIRVVDNDIQLGSVGISFEDAYNDGCVYHGNNFNSNTDDINLNGSTDVIRRDSSGIKATAPASPYVPDNSLYNEYTVAIDLDHSAGTLDIDPPVLSTYGDMIHFTFTQDGTGGKAVGFDTVYKTSWVPVTTLNKINSISFRYDGNYWVQIAATVGM